MKGTMKRTTSWLGVAGAMSVAMLALGQNKVEITPADQVPPQVKAAQEAAMKAAQEKKAAELAAAEEIPVPKPVPATWSDPELERVGTMLTGAWKTATELKQGDDPSKSASVFLGVGHVGIEGMTDTLYFETARFESIHTPYRHGIWQLYKKAGKVHLRTMEFRRRNGEYGALYTMWAAPEVFPPAVTSKDLVGTLDIELAASGGGYSGKTPHAYPTARGGAVEMTSELVIGKDMLQVADKGMDASGKVVWGSDQKVTFNKIDSPVDVRREPNGLVVFGYRSATEGMTSAPKCRVAINYTGWLTDGFSFDTTRKEGGQPFIFEVGGAVIPGFAQGISECRKGERRRLVIPPDLGFGPAGNRRNRIPPQATLIYDIEVLAVEPPAPEPGASMTPVAPGMEMNKGEVKPH